MRNLSANLLAAVAAVVTSPGHLIDFAVPGIAVARWSDIGQVFLSAGTYAAVDMKVQGIGFNGDGKPTGFSLSIGNLDSAVAAFILANDIASATVSVYAVDRAAVSDGDPILLGTFIATQTRIGIGEVQITCAPQFYTAPNRRVDVANGFRYATPAGTVIIWGREPLLLDRLNPDYPGYFTGGD